MSTKFSENSNRHKYLLFNARGFKLGNFFFFLSFWNSLSYNPKYKNVFAIIWSCDPSCKRPIEGKVNVQSDFKSSGLSTISVHITAGVSLINVVSRREIGFQ